MGTTQGQPVAPEACCARDSDQLDKEAATNLQESFPIHCIEYPVL